MNNNNGYHPHQHQIKQLALATEMVFSDDDSLIQDLEDMPTTPRTTTTISLADLSKMKTPATKNGAHVRSPLLLSPREELRLLAVKHKRNSPDRDEEQAPSPPRSHHKRTLGKGRPTTITEKPSLLDMEDQEQNSYNYDEDHHKSSSSSKPVPRVPVVTTTYMDPTTGEAIHTTRPTSDEGLPGPGAISFSSSSSDINQHHHHPGGGRDTELGAGPTCSDSATTTTPVTLGKRLQAVDGELKPNSTTYLPRRLELRPSASDSTTEGGISQATTSVGSNSYLADLGLHRMATASTEDDDDHDRESSSDDVNGVGSGSTNSYVALHQLGQLMDGRNNNAREENTQQQQARRDAAEVEARIRSYTMTPEGKLPLDRYYDDSSFPWKIYVGIGCLLIGVIVGVSVYFATNREPNGGEPGVPAMNSNCKNALPLFNLTGGTVQGEIILDVEGTLGAECQVEPGDGYTLWYSVQGNDQRLSASTCVGTSMDDDLDTQVLVFSGACGKLECIGGSDQLCGSHGSVGWFAERWTLYYIVVKGFRTSNQGVFTLTLDTLIENDSCDGAKEIDSTDKPILWSTRDLTVNDSIATCEEIAVDAPVSWFRISGDGSVMCASVATEETQKPDFVVTMSVLEGLGCSDLNCMGSTSLRADAPWITGDFAFVTSEGTSYYVAVRGEENDSQGDFVLSLAHTPPNGVCEKADPLLISGSSTNGTMVNACNVERSECQGSLNQPGVWYSVEGNGELLIVHVLGLTCRDNFGIQSQVSIFRSDEGCSKLQCVDYTALDCTAGNEKVVSQWFSDPGEIYYVLVQSSNDKDFEVTIDEFLPKGSFTCLNASSLVVAADGGLGTTLGATSANLGQCSNSGAPGVWYAVEGTGGSMEASTCNPGTNYSTGLTILTGECDALQCVPSKTVTCDGQRSMAYWESIPGQQYSVYVHGKESTDVGRFSLTIDDGSLGVENDFCGSAEQLAIPSTTYGSTVNATGDDDYAIMCGNLASAPGVWYTVVGGGRFISASLCGDSTSYDTQIYVFAGDSCKDMTCVNFNEDGCGIQSRISWDAEEGQLYFILVSGFSTAVGDFELIVL
jgi:hypothetical protein